MGRFANFILILAAGALVLFGVAAQTGTISFASHADSGSVRQTAHQEPQAPQKASTVKASPSPTSPQPAPPPPSGGGGDDGD